MRIGEATYFYVRNAQNDIVALVDTAGTTVVRYEYDSWGKSITISGNLAGSIGVQNPFRYKGYYYDTETRMYYVGSRYYEPGIRRFISADCTVPYIGGDIRGYNVYSYCFNSPINMRDPDGNWPVSILVTTNAVKTIGKILIPDM